MCSGASAASVCLKRLNSVLSFSTSGNPFLCGSSKQALRNIPAWCRDTPCFPWSMTSAKFKSWNRVNAVVTQVLIFFWTALLRLESATVEPLCEALSPRSSPHCGATCKQQQLTCLSVKDIMIICCGQCAIEIVIHD